MAEENEKLNKIEELEKRIYYAKNEKSLIRNPKGSLKPHFYNAKKDWFNDDTQMSKRIPKISNKTSLFKNFFLFGLVLFILTLGFSLFRFFNGSNIVSEKNIEINILGNSFVSGGEELSLQVEIVNKNNSPIEFGDIVLQYPKGDSSVSETSSDLVRLRRSLGKLDAGRTKIENFDIVLFGDKGSSKDIKVSLEYRVEGSNAIFVKEKYFPVSINSSPVSISVLGSENVASNEEATLDVKVTLDSKEIVQNMRLKIVYPEGFVFKSATPSPNTGENIWDLGDLPPGAVKNIVIKGLVVGQDGDQRNFHIFTGLADPRDDSKLEVVFGSISRIVNITKSFLETRLLINGFDELEPSITGSDTVNASVVWSNNLSTRVDDLVISAKIEGLALDKNSIKSDDGFYNSLTNEIIWDKNTNRELGLVEPGQGGSLSFSFKPLSSLGSLSNPEISILLGVRGRQPDEGGLVQEIKNSQNKTIKINSLFQITSKAVYSSGPFVNTGPIPPRAEQKTTYTIGFTITNSLNNLSEAVAKTSLPAYVNFTGNVSPSGEKITFDPITREVLWNIGNVPGGLGITSSSKEVFFQVELLPSKSQIDSVPLLINNVRLSGKDTFTGNTLTDQDNSLNTRIFSDSSYNPGDERVME